MREGINFVLVMLPQQLEIVKKEKNF